MVNNKGKEDPMEVGEVQHFQQNQDGSLDIVAYIFPQVPKQLREQIEKNPQMLGMTAQTLPVTDHLVFPDGAKIINSLTEFDELKCRIAYLENRFAHLLDKHGETL